MQLLPLEPNKANRVTETKKFKPSVKTTQRDRQKMKKMLEMMKKAEAKTFLYEEEEDDDDEWSEIIGEMWDFVLKGMQSMVASMANMATELMGS